MGCVVSISRGKRLVNLDYLIIAQSWTGSYFYGTEYEIWGDFGPVGNTEKKIVADFEQLLRLVFSMLLWAKKCYLKKKNCSIRTKKIFFD